MNTGIQDAHNLAWKLAAGAMQPIVGGCWLMKSLYRGFVASVVLLYACMGFLQHAEQLTLPG